MSELRFSLTFITFIFLNSSTVADFKRNPTIPIKKKIITTDNVVVQSILAVKILVYCCK